MSIDATRWAWQQVIIRSTDKLVLLSLADRANEAHQCYPSIVRLAADTGCNRKTVMEAIKRLEDLGLIEANKTWGKGTVYQLVGVSDRHANQSQKRDQSQNRDQYRKRDGTSTKNGTGPVPKTGHEPINNQSRTDQVGEKPGKRFRQPSVEQVAEYCSERGNRVDPESFVDHYTAKGWKVGNTPMKDWRAAVRTWERRDNTVGTVRSALPSGDDLVARQELGRLCRDAGIEVQQARSADDLRALLRQRGFR
jgi:hypothetical protein